MAKKYDAPPPLVIDATKRYIATISTDQGDIVQADVTEKADAVPGLPVMVCVCHGKVLVCCPGSDLTPGHRPDA